MTTKHTSQQIIDGYLSDYRTKKDEFWWAFNEIIEITDSPDGLSFVFELIKSCQNDQELGYVAAGPLEDLLNKHHLVIKNELSELVRQHAIMRKAIQGVWLAKGSPSRRTLDEILDQYGLKYGSLS